jgi:hypothetical protein
MKLGLIAFAKHVKRRDVAPSFGAASLDVANSMLWMRLEESCYWQTIGKGEEPGSVRGQSAGMDAHFSVFPSIRSLFMSRWLPLLHSSAPNVQFPSPRNRPCQNLSSQRIAIDQCIATKQVEDRKPLLSMRTPNY